MPLIVDNTFATPVNCLPFKWGADIVVHSTSKYMDGHASVIGGAVVDSGNFDWDAHADKYPGLTTPDESYHGVVYTKAFGRGGAYITKMTFQLMRDFGSTPSPMSSFMLNLGLESLHVRVQRHCSNATAAAEFLKSHPAVAWVRYPSLPGDEYYERALKYLPDGSCGVVSFGLKGGRDAAEAFMKALGLIAIVTHVADARTSILHPASSTHRQLTDAQLLASGTRPEQMRLSVGIEDISDILADLKNALAAVR